MGANLFGPRSACVGAMFVVLACQLEERSLGYGPKVSNRSTSGQGAAPGDGGVAGGDGDAAGASDGGAAAGAETGSVGGAAVAGGSSGSQGGSSSGGSQGGSSSGGSQSGSSSGGSQSGSSSGGGGNAAGTSVGGNPAVAGTNASGGSGGSPIVEGPCGDVDQNGVEDCSETLVQNARFDVSIEGWAADANLAQVWRTSDARGATSSGSLGLTFTAGGANGGWALAATGQCVQVWGENTYVVGARAYIPDGQGLGQANLTLAMFDNDDCHGTLLAGKTSAFLAQSGVWQVLRGNVKTPPGTRSALLRLAASKPSSQPSLQVYFDDILIRQK